MSRERRQPTSAEWRAITSSRPVVRRVIRSGASYEGRRLMRPRETSPFGVTLTGNTNDDERGARRESVRRFHERAQAERRQIRAAWYGWHCEQAERHRRTLEALIAHHKGEAQKLSEEDRGEGSR